MRKSLLVERILDVTQRHADRLLAERDPRIGYICDLTDKEVEDAIFYTYADPLKNRLDELVKVYQLWEYFYFIEIEKHFPDDADERFQAARKAYAAAARKIIELQEALQEWLRDYYPELDELLKEVEAEERAEAAREAKAKKGKK